MSFRRLLSSLFALALLQACSGSPAPPPEDDASLMSLYEARDFFRLREELGSSGPTPDESATRLFVRAAVQHSFNHPLESTGTLDSLLEREGLDAELKKEALFLRLNNLTRLYDYAGAASTTADLLALGSTLDEEERKDAENMQRMLDALHDAPRQELVSRGATTLDHEGGRIDLRIEGRKMHIPFDTGANLSVLIRSEAERLGLEILPAGIEVGTSTDMKVHADLALAGRVEIGSLDYRNVVFLVFPDELLTFPDGMVIEGVVGFPLIEAMGEVRFREGSLEIPEQVPERELRNLALDQLEPLVRVGYGEDTLLCRLDTGADTTDFYEPFARGYPALVETLGDPQTVKSGGVGGIRELSAWILKDVALDLGGATVTLAEADLYTTAITEEEKNDLHCNVGRDAVEQLGEYAINFRSMSLLRIASPASP